MSDGVLLQPASPRVIDFSNVKDTRHRRENGMMVEYVIDDRPTGGEYNGQGSSKRENMLMSTAQVRRRANRRLKKGRRLTSEAMDILSKPVEDWDEEELARGRPRNAAGTFAGRPPKYIPREIHEQVLDRFKLLIRQRMNYQTLTALSTVQMVMDSDEVDAKGKPIVPASTKLDAAKFLIEHIMGKPTQPQTTDISVKLQGILGAVMVNPQQIDTGEAYKLAHMGHRALPGAPGDQLGVVDAELVDDDDDD